MIDCYESQRDNGKIDHINNTNRPTTIMDKIYEANLSFHVK